MIYVGLDLHKRYITACALDALGQIGRRRAATVDGSAFPGCWSPGDPALRALRRRSRRGLHVTMERLRRGGRTRRPPSLGRASSRSTSYQLSCDLRATGSAHGVFGRSSRLSFQLGLSRRQEIDPPDRRAERTNRRVGDVLSIRRHERPFVISAVEGRCLLWVNRHSHQHLVPCAGRSRDHH